MSRRAGHSRNSTTMDIYVSVLGDPEDKIIEVKNLIDLEEEAETPAENEGEEAA